MTHTNAPRQADLPLGVPGLPEAPENAVEAAVCTLEIDPARPLALAIHTNGLDYSQVTRQGNLAIYRGVNRDGITMTYEVIRIRIAEAHQWPTGAVSPRREVYPSSEQWGTHGWACLTLERAEAKMRELMEVES